MKRREFLRMLGLGAVAAAAGELVAEPVRRIWAVPSNAPVGSRLERGGWDRDPFAGLDAAFAGLDAWLPNEQNGGGPFFGVDRSAPTSLGLESGAAIRLRSYEVDAAKLARYRLDIDDTLREHATALQFEMYMRGDVVITAVDREARTFTVSAAERAARRDNPIHRAIDKYLAGVTGGELFERAPESEAPLVNGCPAYRAQVTL